MAGFPPNFSFFYPFSQDKDFVREPSEDYSSRVIALGFVSFLSILSLYYLINSTNEEATSLSVAFVRFCVKQNVDVHVIGNRFALVSNG